MQRTMPEGLVFKLAAGEPRLLLEEAALLRHVKHYCDEPLAESVPPTNQSQRVWLTVGH